MVCLCLIFVTGLDQLALKSLISTYVVLPPGQFPPMGDLAYFVARMAADSVLIGLQMVWPFLVYGMVFSVGRRTGALDADLAGLLRCNAVAASGRPRPVCREPDNRLALVPQFL